MEDTGFVYKGVRFYTKQIPCAIGFCEDGDIVDLVPFDDVQQASEYLCLCNYRCSNRELSLWTRGKKEEAFIVYLDGVLDGKEKR